MPIGGRNCKLCCVCDESMGQQILLQATMAAAAESAAAAMGLPQKHRQHRPLL